MNQYHPHTANLAKKPFPAVSLGTCWQQPVAKTCHLVPFLQAWSSTFIPTRWFTKTTITTPEPEPEHYWNTEMGQKWNKKRSISWRTIPETTLKKSYQTLVFRLIRKLGHLWFALYNGLRFTVALFHKSLQLFLGFPTKIQESRVDSSFSTALCTSIRHLWLCNNNELGLQSLRSSCATCTTVCNNSWHFRDNSGWIYVTQHKTSGILSLWQKPNRARGRCTAASLPRFSDVHTTDAAPLLGVTDTLWQTDVLLSPATTTGPKTGNAAW